MMGGSNFQVGLTPNNASAVDKDGMPLYPDNPGTWLLDFIGIGNSARQANYQAQLAKWQNDRGLMGRLEGILEASKKYGINPVHLINQVIGNNYASNVSSVGSGGGQGTKAISGVLIALILGLAKALAA